MTDFEMLEQTLKVSIPPGGVVIFICSKDKVSAIDKGIQSIMPILKSKNISAILFNDDVSCIMVPEARRVLPLKEYG